MPSLPKQLLNSLAQLSNFDEQAFVEAHNEENKITSIRLNPFKEVLLEFDLGRVVPWNQNAFYLAQRPSFTLDPLFQAGCYYVQEAGSTFVEFALKQTLNFSESLKVLDLCAAPGGKSTLVNSLLNPESVLVANELIKSRADTLVHNLSKWGTNNTIVTNNDPSRYSELDSVFDAIVVDAPCSGSGLFRKQPSAIEEWSEDAVKACAIRQRKILKDVLPALKSNGILLYSTCSYSVEENEIIVKWLCSEFGMEYLPLSLPKEWGVVQTEAGYRFYPHLLSSEGFFCAVLRKKNSQSLQHSRRKKSNVEILKSEKSVLAPYLTENNYQLIKKNNQFHLLNESAHDFLIDFEKHFYFKKAGIVVGEIKGTDLVPNQELAWSIYQNKKNQRLDLDKKNALDYLRKQNFETASNVLGLSLITYKNQGLGWAKLLQNRINNYLPNELRILS